MWTVSPMACDNIVIRGITVRNPADSPNTDGINPDSCSNVRISDCHVDVGDDCITIKSGKEDDGRRCLRPCENITVTNCTLVRGHGGVVIGSEISGGVRNVAISNCVFVGTDRGIRLKARRGRGGVIEDLRVSNCVMNEVGAALTINLFYGCGAWNDPRVTDRRPVAVDATTPRFRRLRFSNITASNVRWAGIYALGLPEMPIEDIGFNDVMVSLDPDTQDAGAPVMAPDVGKHCRSGALFDGVRGLQLRNVEVTNQLGEPITRRNCVDPSIHNPEG
jgi:polygalacturonase